MGKEKWEQIPLAKISDTYEVSNFGLVRLTDSHKIIPRNVRSGYINLHYIIIVNDKRTEKSVKLHRMVAKAFIENDDPENKTIVNHINGDKLDCRASNLEWVTPSENAQHAIDIGLTKITKRAVIKCNLETGKTIKKYESLLEASKDTGINDGSICNVCTGKRKSTGGFGWKYENDISENSKTDTDFSKYKQIREFPNYIINDEGKIYSLPYKRFLKYQKHQEGTLMVQLTNLGERKDYLVHRLVASYFLENTDAKKNSIKHLDGDKTNNKVDNLEWCYVPGVKAPDDEYDTSYYNPKTAIKSIKRKNANTGEKDLLTANPRNLSKKQREERKKLLNNKKNSGSKTSKPKLKK